MDTNNEDFNLEEETTYGHCLAENPYWFIPDLENSDKQLLSWRHDLSAVKQGTFECPEHYFWKTIDSPKDRALIKKFIEESIARDQIMSDSDEQINQINQINQITIHGHNSPWGMGISAFSDKVNLWEEFPGYKWLIALAESDASDDEFLAQIKAHVEARNTQLSRFKKQHCPFCGNTEHPEGAKFCKICGKPRSYTRRSETNE